MPSKVGSTFLSGDDTPSPIFSSFWFANSSIYELLIELLDSSTLSLPLLRKNYSIASKIKIVWVVTRYVAECRKLNLPSCYS